MHTRYANAAECWIFIRNWLTKISVNTKSRGSQLGRQVYETPESDYDSGVNFEDSGVNIKDSGVNFKDSGVYLFLPIFRLSS